MTSFIEIMGGTASVEPAPGTEPDGLDTRMTEVMDLKSGESDGSLRMIAAMKKVCKEEGGPRQHLNKVWGLEEDSDNKLEEFYTGLMRLLPPDATILYHDNKNIPQVGEDDMGHSLPLVFHPAMFSMSAKASVKGPPEAHVVEKLVEQICMDGFVSGGEPLLIMPLPDSDVPALGLPPPVLCMEPHQAIAPFSIGYVKGQARVLTMLCMLSLAIEDNVDLTQVTMQDFAPDYVPYQFHSSPCIL